MKFATRALSLATMVVLSASPSVAQGPGWTAVSTVKAIVNTSNGGINVRLTPELSGCVSQSGYGEVYASIHPSHPGINRMKADLLFAAATGKQVMLYLGDGNCYVSETLLLVD
jgi:hypothetical protein